MASAAQSRRARQRRSGEIEAYGRIWRCLGAPLVRRAPRRIPTARDTCARCSRCACKARSAYLHTTLGRLAAPPAANAAGRAHKSRSIENEGGEMAAAASKEKVKIR